MKKNKFVQIRGCYQTSDLSTKKIMMPAVDKT